jgi:acetaldehyde/propanal dehydrogenase
MVKALRSAAINPVWMVGIDPASDGLARARAQGLKTTTAGVDDAAAASGRGRHPYRLRRNLGLCACGKCPQAAGRRRGGDRPHARGDRSVLRASGESRRARRPARNERQHGHLRRPGHHPDGVRARRRVQPVDYAEIVATVASKSAGPGTRTNIDEFTRTTARAASNASAARQRGKAIIILNPAEPPLIMRDTVHCLTAKPADTQAITRIGATR